MPLFYLQKMMREVPQQLFISLLSVLGVMPLGTYKYILRGVMCMLSESVLCHTQLLRFTFASCCICDSLCADLPTSNELLWKLIW